MEEATVSVATAGLAELAGWKAARRMTEEDKKGK